jgi:(1->4)-alpha-D-glucan 1-alpha-D-glucosylmutase
VNTPYEDALARFVDGALGALDPNPFIADWLALEPRIALAGCVNSLAQAAIRLTAPGVPDTYQGTELWDDSLVDPDNRRAVDYARRAALLQGVQDADPAALLAQWRDGRVKLRLVWQLLALRRSHEEFFARAGYAGWRAKGAHAASVCAFARRRGDVEIACIVPRLWQAMVGDTPRWPLGAELWKDTRVAIPGAARAWRNVLTGEAFDAVRELPLGSVLSTFPVAVLERI